MGQILSLVLKILCVPGWIALLALGASLVGGCMAFAADHPLDPLTQDEIATTVQVLKAGGKITQSSRFPIIVLNEPPKEKVLKFEAEKAMRREAFAVVYERGPNQTFEAIVDCDHRSLLSWKEVPGVQPYFMNEDDDLTEEIVRADPRWQEALRKRGITDFEHVQIDPWPAGSYDFGGMKGVRAAIGVSYYKAGSVNPYARPIEGVTAIVDLNAKKVIKLVDTGVVPVATATADFDEHSVGKLRTPPETLQIVQPQGASFEVRGHEVRWQNWHFRFALHAREGLVLYTVGYEDQGRLRSVLYRGSLSEMVVPYADPDTSWYFRNVFDEGELGVGQLVQPLEPLTDVPPNTTLFDAVLANDHGKPYEIHRAVALYERDGGILWKHVDEKTNKNESRRARELVLSCVSAIGNYDYGFNWVFHQDGTLEMEILLTGTMEPKGVSKTTDAVHSEKNNGHLVAERIEAVHHQHFFNFRLDMDVDGATQNSVVEIDTESVPAGPDNPKGNAFEIKERALSTEQEAQRHLNLTSSRKWKVINRSVRNALRQPVGYVLFPEENSVPYATPDSSLLQRAGFLNAHLWVTRYDPTEMYAAGNYVNQSQGGDGLPKWIRANRSIDGQDIVLWYTMGITHITRPEDWPVMPVHRAGFKLVPSGFFTRNPALDVPKPAHHGDISSRE